MAQFWTNFFKGDVPLDVLRCIQPIELVMMGRTLEMADLENIQACTRLERLAFHKCEMTDKGVIRFANALKDRLKGLTLESYPRTDTPFTDEL